MIKNIWERIIAPLLIGTTVLAALSAILFITQGWIIVVPLVWAIGWIILEAFKRTDNG